jgi:hypothetical protein
LRRSTAFLFAKSRFTARIRDFEGQVLRQHHTAPAFSFERVVLGLFQFDRGTKYQSQRSERPDLDQSPAMGSRRVPPRPCSAARKPTSFAAAARAFLVGHAYCCGVSATQLRPSTQLIGELIATLSFDGEEETAADQAFLENLLTSARGVSAGDRVASCILVRRELGRLQQHHASRPHHGSGSNPVSPLDEAEMPANAASLQPFPCRSPGADLRARASFPHRVSNGAIGAQAAIAVAPDFMARLAHARLIQVSLHH